MFEKFRESKTFKIVKGIATSAILALILSLLFFAYDVYKDASLEKRNSEHFVETVKQLDQIRQSLSTRFLGTFPVYLTEINRVFANLQPQDTVVVCEDLLYYGIKSCPEEFRRFNESIIAHAQSGGKVMIVYYDNHPLHADVSWNSIFYRVSMESLIPLRYVSMIKNEHRKRMRETGNASKHNWHYAVQLDSILTEKYFHLTFNDDPEAAETKRQGYLSKALIHPHDSILKTSADTIVQDLCLSLDSIKQSNLGNGKTIKDVRFSDYMQMYSDMTDCIVQCYRRYDIELIPINEYLTMSCWLIMPSDKSRPTEAILAFPSKYASDEIGFYSQDVSFSQYIMTMLSGIRGNMQ